MRGDRNGVRPAMRPSRNGARTRTTPMRVPRAVPDCSVRIPALRRRLRGVALGQQGRLARPPGRRAVAIRRQSPANGCGSSRCRGKLLARTFAREHSEGHGLKTSGHCRCAVLLAATALIGASFPAAATDVVPIFGGRVGGTVANRVEPYDAAGPSSFSVASSESYGGIIDLPLAGGVRAVELYFSRQPSTLQGGEFLAPPVGALTVDVMHIGLVDSVPDEDPRLAWLLIGTGGVTRFEAHSNSDTRLSIGLGGGVRWMLSPHIGLRGDLRALVTFASGGEAVIVCSGGCAGHYQGALVVQGEATVGVVVRF